MLVARSRLECVLVEITRPGRRLDSSVRDAAQRRDAFRQRVDELIDLAMNAVEELVPRPNPTPKPKTASQHSIECR